MLLPEFPIYPSTAEVQMATIQPFAPLRFQQGYEPWGGSGYDPFRGQGFSAELRADLQGRGMPLDVPPMQLLENY